MIDRSRVGAPYSLAIHDMNLSTVIGRTNRDSSGQLIDPNMQNKLHRLRTLSARTEFHDSTYRNYRTAFMFLNTLRDKLNLPNAIVERTAYTYRKFQEKGLIRGRTIQAVLAACLYLTCREMAISRSLDEIQEASNVRRKLLGKTYRELARSMQKTVPQLDFFQCIEKIGNKAQMDERVIRQSLRMMQSALDLGISAGKDPMGLAASILYVTNKMQGRKMKLSEMAKAAGVTEVTIRNRSKDLKKRMNLTF
jgi:transcription initiation factor TFIIB